ncbi:LCP family protein required for cell wall assembly [Paenibacillus sp. DS2015]|uniref:LCP family protein n=1 Tax=Paenibacillus sp. DS2015 TaxID=3373917 RepID=UPI003D1BB3B0
MKKRTKGLIIAVTVLLLVGASSLIFQKQLAILAFDLFLSEQVEDTLQAKSYKPLEGDQPLKAETVSFQTKPFSMLLLGTDQRGDETARSDTMMYAVVRPKESKVLLVSVPRDTYTEIVGKGKKDKVNHAFAFGGQQMAMDTMEALLDHELEYYATINFIGLKDAVDALGGVELPIGKDIVNKEADHEKFTVEANKPIYTGEEALNYVRYREDSGFNRTKRQQIFLDSVAKKMKNLNQITKIPDLLEIMGSNFQTNMQPKFIIDLAKQIMTGNDTEIVSYSISGTGVRINGVYYDEPDEDTLKYAQDMIDNWMSQSTTSEQLMQPDDQELE